MLKSTRLLVSFLVLLVLSLAVIAQTGTSNITGTVRDTNGAVVAGATVTAKNEATGVTSTQTTTESGLYSFASLPVGNYTITVEKQGFKTLQKTNNALQVGEPLTVDGALEIGQVSETVTVSGGTEQLQTANATIGNVVEQKAIEALPLNGRNPLTLLVLEPGVVQVGVPRFVDVGEGARVAIADRDPLHAPVRADPLDLDELVLVLGREGDPSRRRHPASDTERLGLDLRELRDPRRGEIEQLVQLAPREG